MCVTPLYIFSRQSTCGSYTNGIIVECPLSLQYALALWLIVAQNAASLGMQRGGGGSGYSFYPSPESLMLKCSILDSDKQNSLFFYFSSLNEDLQKRVLCYKELLVWCIL